MQWRWRLEKLVFMVLPRFVVRIRHLPVLAQGLDDGCASWRHLESSEANSCDPTEEDDW